MPDYIDSYYTATRRINLEDTAPLKGEHRADVIVIGGGVSGCSSALHLAQQGYRVVLLEARRIGWGASGRSGGQLLNGFGTDLSTLEKQLGLAGAKQAWAMSREAVALAATLIDTYDIPCDLRWGALDVAVKPRHIKALRAHERILRETYAYDGCQWLSQEAVYEHVRCKHYLGGLYDASNGHLHPLNYTLGLARAAQSHGARIHEGSAVVRLERGDEVTAFTHDGAVTAKFLIVAGNAYLQRGLLPELRGKVMPIGNYIAATEPLSEQQVAQTLPRDDAVADANFVLDYYRLSADKRMLYGGFVGYGKRPPRRLRQRMAHKLGRLFPVLADVRMDYQWEGMVGITFNRAPHVGRLDSNIYYLQGFSGHGMALTGLCGKIVAELIDGQSRRFDLFARIQHRRFPGNARFRTPLLVLATTFYRMRDWL